MYKTLKGLEPTPSPKIKKQFSKHTLRLVITLYHNVRSSCHELPSRKYLNSIAKQWTFSARPHYVQFA